MSNLCSHPFCKLYTLLSTVLITLILLAEVSSAWQMPLDETSGIVKTQSPVNNDKLISALYYLSAESRLSTGDTTGAIEIYTRLIELRPYSAAHARKRIELYRKTMKYDSVIFDCSRIIKLSKSTAWFNRTLERLGLQAENNRAFYQERGFANFQLGNFKTAIEDFDTTIIKSRIVYVVALYFRALAKIQEGDLKNARLELIELTEYVTHISTVQWSQLSLPLQSIDMHEYTTPISTVQWSRLSHPLRSIDSIQSDIIQYSLTLKQIYLQLEACYKIDDSWKGAERTVKNDLGRRIENPALWYVLARVYEKGKKKKKAIKYFQKVIEISDNPGGDLELMSQERLDALEQ